MSTGVIDVPATSFGRFPGLLGQPPFLETDIRDAEEQLATVVADMAPGQLLLEEREFGGSTQQTIPSTLQERRELRAGRGNSARKVGFWRLSVGSPRAQNDPTDLAVKKYDDVASMAHEWVMFDALNSLTDRQVAFLQLGVWMTNRKKPRTLTLFEEEVQSLDNVFWPSHKDAHKITSWEVFGAYLMSFHTLGITHGAGFIADDMASVRNPYVTLLGECVSATQSRSNLPSTAG